MFRKASALFLLVLCAMPSAVAAADFPQGSTDTSSAFGPSQSTSSTPLVGPTTSNGGFTAPAAPTQTTAEIGNSVSAETSGGDNSFVGPPSSLAPSYGGDSSSAWGGSAGGGSPYTDLKSTSFRFDPSPLSPTTTRYAAGSGNIQTLLTKIANILLVVVSTFAVLFIAVGGFMMAISAGDSDRATKGRSIVTYNVQALIVAMFAYGIVKFVLWVVWN